MDVYKQVTHTLRGRMKGNADTHTQEKQRKGGGRLIQSHQRESAVCVPVTDGDSLISPKRSEAQMK